jgi:glycosyltransferase involved in cell wall biosynthesis
MRVGYDATGWGSARGPGRFVRELLRRLVALGDAEYVAIAAQGQPTEGFPAVPLREVPLRGDRRSRTGADLARLGRAARALDLDVLLFPYVATWFPAPRVPSVVGVYDVIAGTLPALHLRGRVARTRWRAKEAAAVRTARAVFTISETSRADVASRFGLDASRIAVVPGAPSEAFRPRDDGEVDAVLASRELHRGRYVVCFGGLAPRKNVETVLAGYARAAASADRLVLVGEPRRAGYVRELEALGRRLGLEQQVVFTGFVPDDELACLLSGASAFVTASLAEGFGLPAVEAAACGVPVVVSDLPAHRESLGAAATYFAPTSPDELADALAAASDPARRDELGGAARRAAATLSWDPGVRRLRALLDAAASG